LSRIFFFTSTPSTYR